MSENSKLLSVNPKFLKALTFHKMLNDSKLLNVLRVIPLLPKRLGKQNLVSRTHGGTIKRTFAMNIISTSISLGTCDITSDYQQYSLTELMGLNQNFFDDLIQDYPGNMDFNMTRIQLKKYARDQLKLPDSDQDLTFRSINQYSENILSFFENTGKELPYQQWLIRVPVSTSNPNQEVFKLCSISMEPVYQYGYTEEKPVRKTCFEVLVRNNFDDGCTLMTYSMLELLYFNYENRFEIIDNIFNKLFAEV